MADFPAAADSVNELLAMRIGKGAIFDLDIDFANIQEDMVSQEMDQSDEILAIERTDNIFHCLEKRRQDMIYPLTQPRDNRRPAGLHLVALQKDHCNDPDERYVK